MILTKAEEQSKIKEVLHLFAKASMENDQKQVENLLHDDGAFQLEFKHMSTVLYNKSDFLNRYFNKIKEIPITKITEDLCGNCCLGEHIVLFNDGEFPKPFISELVSFKVGYKIELKDDKIIDLQVCTAFLSSENPSVILGIINLEMLGYKFTSGFTKAFMAKAEAKEKNVKPRRETKTFITEEGETVIIRMPYGFEKGKTDDLPF